MKKSAKDLEVEELLEIGLFRDDKLLNIERQKLID